MSRRREPTQRELPVRWRLAAGDYVAALAPARDGQRCVAGLGNGDVLGLELASGKVVFQRRAHEGSVLGVSLAPEPTRFVTCGHEPSAKIWSAKGELVRELPGGGTAWVEHVAWAPSGGRIATAAGRKVRVWTALGEPLFESDAFASTVSSIAWRRDGSGLAATCYGGVHILPIVDQAKARHLAWKGSLISMAWSPDGNVIACGSQDATVHFWRLDSGQDAEMSGYRFKPKALAWDNESKLLATAGDASVTVWDFRGRGPEGTRPIQLSAHLGACTRLAFSPRKAVIASGSQDSSVLLWEPRRGTEPIHFAFLEDEVTALAWHPDHHTLLGADADGNIAAWAVS